MTLRTLRDACSTGQAAIGLLSIVTAGGVAPVSLVAAIGGAVWAFVRPLPPSPSRASDRLWTLLVFGSLVVTLIRAFAGQEFLDAGIDFLLLLVVQRLFNRQRAREHMQLVMLGALLMVAGAVLNTGLDYPLLFSAYLAVATMALLLNHLLAEGERLGPVVAFAVERQPATRIRALWRAALGTAVLAGVGGLVTFVIFPRFGMGLFLRGELAREPQSGFSDKVELGTFGTIKSDTTVVMHLRTEDAPPGTERLDWHLRGSSFDHYEGGHWTRSPEIPTEELVGLGPYRVFAHQGNRVAEQDPDRPRIGRGQFTPRARAIEGFSASTVTARAVVTLEDLGVDVLIAASEPLGVKLQPRGRFEQLQLQVAPGQGGELRVRKLPGPIQYEFAARIGVPTRAELAAVGEPDPAPELGPYLQRARSLSPAVAELARTLAGDGASRLAKVEAVMEHLAGFAYTLDLVETERVKAGADPLEGFLFDTRAGHCEYFATAMAVLLREVGVPARNVNGYYGAHWNPIGEFYAVRQAEAHSWVEVHFGPLGWVTFDPTPPAGRTAGDGAALWPAASQILDAVRNAYLEWVIDYDLGKQASLLDRLGVRGGGGTNRPRVPPALFVAVGAVAAVWVYRRLRRPGSAAIGAETRVYLGLLRRLRRRGHVRSAHESATAFATRVLEAGGPDLRAFAALYERARFGSGPTPAELEQLERLAKAGIRDADRAPS